MMGAAPLAWSDSKPTDGRVAAVLPWDLPAGLAVPYARDRRGVVTS
jgi:hypothetical protein